MTSLESFCDDLARALSRLQEVLLLERNDVIRDSAIQRFEFTADLSWKALKAYLEIQKGLICKSPKDCFREAFRVGLLEYDEYFLEIIDLRNETSHTYREECANSVFAQLPKAAIYFEKVLTLIRL